MWAAITTYGLSSLETIETEFLQAGGWKHGWVGALFLVPSLCLHPVPSRGGSGRGCLRSLSFLFYKAEAVKLPDSPASRLPLAVFM